MSIEPFPKTLQLIEVMLRQLVLIDQVGGRLEDATALAGILVYDLRHETDVRVPHNYLFFGATATKTTSAASDMVVITPVVKLA